MPLSLPKGLVKFQASKWIIGTRKVVRELKKLAGKEGVKELDVVFKESAKRVFDESQEIVPVDTEDLKNSGVVEKPARESLLWQVRYGDGNGYKAPHAAVVHQGGRNSGGVFIPFNFRNGKESHYVQKPFMKELDVLEKKSGQTIQKLLSRLSN